MRFLQLEWHNHERARNAWDIERAEMKAKIAKQEGEVRSAKKLNDQLNKHIRMLEQALTNERKKKAAGDDQPSDDKKEARGKKNSGKRALRPLCRIHNCQRRLILCSSKQASQLLLRRRFRVPRPIRRRPRRTAREVQDVPYQMCGGDHLSSDAPATASATAAWYAWAG